jgi:hypothetical protein
MLSDREGKLHVTAEGEIGVTLGKCQEHPDR